MTDSESEEVKMTVVEVATADVVIGKFADVAPGEIVTKEFVFAAAGSDEDSVTVTPPEGAGDEMDTVPVTIVDDPPCTVAGLTAIPTRVGPIIAVVKSPPPAQPKTQAVASSDMMRRRNTSAL